MNKKFKNLLLSILSAATAATAITATALGVTAVNKASASAAAETSGFEMVDGAGIRMATPLGLRFIAEMNADVYTDLMATESGVTKKMGMYIVPYTYLSDESKYTYGSTDIAERNYQNLKQKIDHVFYDSTKTYSSDDPDGKIYSYTDSATNTTTYRANGVITNLFLQNYDREFIGIGYIAETTSAGTTYSFASFNEEDNVRNSTYVAVEAYEAYTNANARAIFNEYVWGAHLEEQGVMSETVQKDENGVRTGVTYSYGGKTDYTSITDVAKAAGVTWSVSLNKTAVYVKNVGDTYDTLTATIADNGAEVTFGGAHAVWSSSNEDVVTVDKNGKLTAVGAGTATVTASFMGASATCEVIVDTITFEEGLPSYIQNGGRASLAVVDENGKKVLQATSEMNDQGNVRIMMPLTYLGAFFENSDVQYLAFDLKLPEGATTGVSSIMYHNLDQSNYTAYESTQFDTTPTDAYKSYYFPRSVYETWVVNGKTEGRFLNVQAGITQGASYWIDNIRAATEKDYTADLYSFETGSLRNMTTEIGYCNPNYNQFHFKITGVDASTAKFTNENVSDGMRAIQFTKTIGESVIMFNGNADPSMETGMRAAGYISFDLYVPEGSDAKIKKSGFEWYGALKQGWNTVYEQVSVTDNEIIRFTDSTASTYVIDNFRLLTAEEYNKAKFGFEAGGVLRNNNADNDTVSGWTYYYAGWDKANNKAAIQVMEGSGTGDVATLSNVRFATEQVHGGDYSLAFDKKSGWMVLAMASDSEMYSLLKNGFTFWVYSTVAMDGASNVEFVNGNGAKFNDGAGISVAANTWTQVKVTADDLHPTACRFLILQLNKEGTVYIDDIEPLPTYTITYDAGDGTLTTTEQTVVEGGAYTLATPTTKVYQEFLGWYDEEGNLVENGVWNFEKDIVLTAQYSDALTFDSMTAVPSYLQNGGRATLSIVDGNGGKVLQATSENNDQGNVRIMMTIAELGQFFEDEDVQYMAFDLKLPESAEGTSGTSILYANAAQDGWVYYETSQFDAVPTDAYKTYYLPRSAYENWVANGVTEPRILNVQAGVTQGASYWVDNFRPVTAAEYTADLYSFETGSLRNMTTEIGYCSPSYDQFHLKITNVNASAAKFTNENVFDGMRAITFTKYSGDSVIMFNSNTDTSMETEMRAAGYVAFDLYVPEGSDAKIVRAGQTWYGTLQQGWNTVYEKINGYPNNEIIRFTDTTASTYVIDNFCLLTKEEYNAAMFGFETGGVIRDNNSSNDTTSGGWAYYYAGADKYNNKCLVGVMEGGGDANLTTLSNVRFATEQVHGGKYSLAFDKEAGYICLQTATDSTAYSLLRNGFTFWMYSTAAISGTSTDNILNGANGKLNGGYGINVAANTWTQITVTADDINSTGRFLILQGDTEGTIYIDDIEALPYEVSYYKTDVEATDEDGVLKNVTLNQSTYSDSSDDSSDKASSPTSADMSYIEFHGKYGLNDYVVFDFTGDNMPIVSFFNSEVTKTVFNNASAGGTVSDTSVKGWVWFNGLYNLDGSVYGSENASNVHETRLILIGSHKVVGFDNNNNDFRLACGSTTDINPLSIYALKSVKDTYRMILGIATNESGKTCVDMAAINMVTGITVYKHQWEVDRVDFEEGSIALHGQFGKTTVLDKVFGVEENTNLDDLITKYAAIKDTDYSDEAAVTLDRYGYASLSNGQWTLDGDPQVTNPTDWRNEENTITVGGVEMNQYEVYANAGFNIVLAQDMISPDVTAEEWAANGEKYMDYANEAGLKVILTDWHLQVLSKPITPTSSGLTASDATYVPWIIGTDANATDGLAKEWLDIVSSMGLTMDERFASRDALDNYVRAQLALYKDHPAFYGVMLGDEPSYHNAYCYSEIYKSIKRVMPECYVQYNLMPMESDTAAIERYYTGIANTSATNAQIETAYKSYVEKFLDAMGTDYIQYDDYPFKSSTDGMWFWETTTPYVDTTSLRNIQLVAEIAKERGLSVKVVTQSSIMKKGGADGNVLIRQITENDARWLNNYLMGFGVKQINYFTYWTKYANSSSGEYFEDGGSFVNRDGTTTAVYDFMKTIMADNTKFAPTISHFDYSASQVVGSDNGDQNNDHISWSSNLTATADFRLLDSVTTSLEYTLVTELYDKDNYNYMYMVMNTIDPNEGGTQSVTVTLDSSVTAFYVYAPNGESTLVEGNTYTVSLTAGQAVYIMPCAWSN